MNSQGQLLTPFQRKLLLKQIKTELRPEYRRRIEIMLLADAGQSKTQICTALGCSQKTAQYWIGIARTGSAHLWNDCPIGRPQTISDQYLDRLKELVSHSPRDYGYAFKRWTAQSLSKHLERELDIQVSDRHVSRLLKSMGLSTRSPSTDAAIDVSKAKDSGIAIYDLKPAASSDLLLPLNPISNL